MTSIEKLEEILIRENHAKWEKNNPPQRNLWDELNKVALKLNSPDLVKGKYINNKPLNQTMWKKTYITPQLEYKNNIIMENQLKGALKLYTLMCLYPFVVVIFLCSL